MAALAGGELLTTPPGFNSSARVWPQSRHVCAVDLFDAAVQAGQEYSIPMEEDLTVSHSVPVQRSPCFFEVFFADDPNLEWLMLR